jgi:hypothetical protein
MKPLLVGAAATVMLLVGLTVNLHAGVWAPLEAYEAQHPEQFGSLLARTDPSLNILGIICLAALLVLLAVRRSRA